MDIYSPGKKVHHVSTATEGRTWKQEFSLAHLTVLGCPPPEMIYIAARAGYDYVSIRTIYMGLPGEPDYALADNPQMLKQTKQALASTGLRVHDIELARVYEGVHPTKYLPAMEVAAELGAKAVLSSIWGGEREFYIEKFGEICDLAKPFGLTVDLEYVPIAAVASLAQAVDVLRAVNRSNAGLMVDMHHFHRARDDPADLDAVPREWFHFAQLCDAPAEIPTERAEMIRIMREARMYVGEGGIDVAEHPRAHPALRILDRAAQQGAARGDRLCGARDPLPRDAEGVPRRAFRGQERARQAPFRTCNFCQPSNRRSVLNETTSDCDTQGVPAPLRIRGCLTATLSSVIRSRIRSRRLSTRGSRARPIRTLNTPRSKGRSTASPRRCTRSAVPAAAA